MALLARQRGVVEWLCSRMAVPVISLKIKSHSVGIAGTAPASYPSVTFHALLRRGRIPIQNTAAFTRGRGVGKLLKGIAKVLPAPSLPHGVADAQDFQ